MKYFKILKDQIAGHDLRPPPPLLKLGHELRPVDQFYDLPTTIALFSRYRELKTAHV